MPSIRFLPADVAVDCSEGETVFEVGWRAEIDIETACVGGGSCGLCRVRIVSGEEHLGPFSEIEQKHLGNVYFLNKVRLSCQTVVNGGDVVVELAPKKKTKRDLGRPPSR
jgi:2Fe-2S ferredoxin